MSTEAPHLSIGEVLAQLREEFPDITISKIRFLESQGLIDPERTPSGYRKFYDDDLARLRWILYQQKEHFLPLKVIKDRLDEMGPGDPALLEPSSAVLAGTDNGDSPTEAEVPPPAAATPEAGTPRPRRARPRRPAFAPDVPVDTTEDEAMGAIDDAASASCTRAELAGAAGITEAQVAELESFGLLAPSHESAGEARYGDEAVEIARIAAGFFQRGVEARHLRMYRMFAEREAGLFGQVLLPYVRQRNPEARARLQDELVDLATLGRRLRTVMLRLAARETLAE